MSSFKRAILNCSYIGEMKERLLHLPCSSLVVLCVSNHPDSTGMHRRINRTPVFADFSLVNCYQPITDGCCLAVLCANYFDWFSFLQSLAQHVIIYLVFLQVRFASLCWQCNCIMEVNIGIPQCSCSVMWVYISCLCPLHYK